MMSSNSRRHLLLLSHCVLGVDDADDTRRDFAMDNSLVALANYVDTRKEGAGNQLLVGESRRVNVPLCRQFSVLQALILHLQD